MRPGPMFVLLAAAAPLQAGLTVQSVLPEPSFQEVAAGETAVLTIVYDSDDSTVTGLGVRVYYDSSKLTLETAEVLVPFGFAGSGDQVGGDGDGDPATDRNYIAAWFEIGGSWPGENVTLPVDLLRLHFTTHFGFLSTQVTIAGSSCAECTFETRPATINVVGGGPTFTPTFTPSATATVTPLPTPTFGPSPTPEDFPPFLPLPPTAPPQSPTSVQAIPALSGLGVVLLVVAVTGSAVALLLRRRI